MLHCSENDFQLPKNHRHKRTKSNINSRNKGWCWSIQLLAVVFSLSLFLSLHFFGIFWHKRKKMTVMVQRVPKDAMNIMLKSKTPWLCKQMNSFNKTFAAHKKYIFRRVWTWFSQQQVLFPVLHCSLLFKKRTQKSDCVQFLYVYTEIHLFAMGKKWKCVWLVPEKQKFNQKITVRMI